MEIGEKIKSLRRSKRMTQAELAGDQITRNMLSLIENGSALPSLPTIIYLSERLGVSAGMLLAREDEELVYKKLNELPKIKQVFASGEYRLCSEMCKSLLKKQTDDEVGLILSKCYFEIAKESFNIGKLHQSARYFDKACESCKQTIYAEDKILSSVAIYFEYMMRLSPSIDSEGGYDIYEGACLYADPFCRYAVATKRFEEGNDCFAREYVELSGASDRCYAEHLKARLEIKAGDYRSAKERLNKLLNCDDLECRVILYDIFKDLEECCRMTDDYKGAYEYSVGKVELLEHMLREDSL